MITFQFGTSLNSKSRNTRFLSVQYYIKATHQNECRSGHNTRPTDVEESKFSNHIVYHCVFYKYSLILNISNQYSHQVVYIVMLVNSCFTCVDETLITHWCTAIFAAHHTSGFEEIAIRQNISFFSFDELDNFVFLGLVFQVFQNAWRAEVNMRQRLQWCSTGSRQI